MQRSRVLASMLAVLVLVGGIDKLYAVVLISDDFSSASSGVGWAPGNSWEGHTGGVASTNPTGAANVVSFRDFATPLDASAGVTYIRIDYAQVSPANGNEWGGLAFFTGIEGSPADETFFVGNPAPTNFYGLDLKIGTDTIVSGPVPIDGQSHTLIAAIDTTGPNHSFKFWVDNVNLSAPSASYSLTGAGPITGPWGTLRLQSFDTTTDTYDNLVIGTTAQDVGLVASPLTLNVNRATGAVSLSSATPIPNVVGYSLDSNNGGLNPAQWISITGNYDDAGNGSFDPNDDWTKLSTDPSDTTNLAESTFDVSPGDGGTIGASPVNLGNVWVRSPFEDLYATITVDNGGTPMKLAANVVYTGTPIVKGDLNGDGSMTAADWGLFKSGQGAVSNTLTAVAAYQLGDLDGNFQHNLSDFDLFAEAYDMANGVGAFAAMVSAVPEPSAVVLLALGLAACTLTGRRKTSGAVVAAVALLLVGAASNSAHATVYAQDDFSSEGSGIGWAAGDVWGNVTGGVADTQFVNAVFRDFVSPIDPISVDKLYIGFDFKTTAGNQWGGLAFFTGTGDNHGSETLFIGDPGQFDDYGIDLHQGSALRRVPNGTTDQLFHRLVVELDFDDDNAAPFDDKYSLWVDGGDVNNPSATVTIQNSPIAVPWGQLRLQSAGGGEFFQVDNLIITDQAELVFSPTLNLLVDKATGDVSVRNMTGTPIPMSAYSITSAAGMLNVGTLPGDFDSSGTVDGRDFLLWQRSFPMLDAQDLADWQENYGESGGGVGGWSSLADQHPAGFPAGNGTGNGWEEGANPSPSDLAEYYLTGQSTVGVGANLSLGEAYGGGAAGLEDLQFIYRSNGELKVGSITYTGGIAAISAVPEPGCGLLALYGAVALVGSMLRLRIR